MRKNFVFAAALLVSTLVHSQDSTKALHEVVITANKFPQKQNTTGKVVTVINQEILGRNVGKTLPELLNQQAGLTIIGSQNNLGTNQDVYMRGAATGKTLILVDGVPAYDPSTISNAFDLNHFSIENIERIEIVRGAMSTLYGSDAVAGVINIITKKGKGRRVSMYGLASGGSYNTYKGSAGINGSFKKNNYNIQYSRLQSKGFSSAYDSTGAANFDKDGYNQNAVSGNLKKQLTDKLSWRLNGQYGKYETDLDNDAFKDEKDHTFSSANYQAGSVLEYKYNKGAVFFNYNYNKADRKFFDDSIFVGGFAKYTKQRYMGRSHFAELYSNFELNKHITLLAGTDYRSQNTDQNFFSISSFGKYESNRTRDTTEMKQYSAYASAFLKGLANFQLEIGGRYNHHSEYGNNFTYTVNPSYLVNDHLKFFANIASAFKAPSLYQLFVINNAGRNPTGSLKPETSRTIDAGVEFTGKANSFNARAVYFNRNIKNGIDYSFITYQYFNYNRQNDHGLELEASTRVNKISVNGNYSYVTGEVNTLKYKYDAPTFSYISTGDTTFNNLFRRPQHAANITVGYAPVEKVYVSLHARLAGKRYEPAFMGTPIEMKAYQTVDVYGEYTFNSRLKAFGDFKNIFNEQYFDVRGYNSRRFNFMAGFHVNL